jgi:hypothetical protein
VVIHNLSNTEIFEEFVQAANQIREDLNIKAAIETDHAEGEMGFDFTARAYDTYRGFDFWLNQKIDKTKRRLRTSLSIDFQEGVAPFNLTENIDYIVGHSDFLCRWAAWAVFNFRQAHERTNLNSIFHEAQIRVYGVPHYCDPAEGEANLLFKGILELQKDKVLIYKFRHVDPPNSWLLRSFSYAVWVYTGENPPFWVVFPNFCGLEGGRSFSTYKQFEKFVASLKPKLEVEVRRFDVPYEKLETFLLGHAEGFYSVYRETDLHSFFYYDGPAYVLEGSETEFEKFKERFLNKEYPQALRDLRALIQQAEENLAKQKGIDCSPIKEPDVNKLASLLIEHGVIDGRLRSWFGAFTAIANLASHRNFPSVEDMKPEADRTRIMLTFQLGFQLLEELDKPLRKSFQ